MEVILKTLIGENLIRLIAPFALIAIGYFVERRFVSRITMFTNAVALYTFYYPVTMSTTLAYIVNTSIIIGILGGIAYALKLRLFQQFYYIAWISSSTVTAALILYGLTL